MGGKQQYRQANWIVGTDGFQHYDAEFWQRKKQAKLDANATYNASLYGESKGGGKGSKGGKGGKGGDGKWQGKGKGNGKGDGKGKGNGKNNIDTNG